MASIPLSVTSPQIQGPLTTLGQVLQTRDLAGRIQQQQAQTADIQAQADQRNRDLADQNTLQEAMRDPDTHARMMTGDFSDVTGKIQPKTLFGVQKAQQDYLAQKLTNTKAQNEDRLEAYGEINNALKGLSTLRKPDGTLDLDRINQGLQATVSNLQKAGVFQRAGIDSSQYVGRTFTDPNQFYAAAAGTNGEMAITQQALDTQKSQAETAAQQATATSKNVDGGAQRQQDASLLATAANHSEAARQAVFNSLPPERQAPFQGLTKPEDILKIGQTPEQITQATQKGQELAETANRDRNLAANQRGELDVKRAELGVQQYNAGVGPDGKPIQYTDPQTGQTQGVSPIAQAIANYKLPPAAARSYSANRGLMNQVLAANPDFDIANYETRQNVAKDFANDKPNSAGGQVLALNTLVHHAQLYQDVANSLKNGTFTPGNAVYNSVAQAFGSSPPTNANLVAQFLAGETAKAAGGSQAEGEVTRILGSLSKNASPQQISDTGKTILQIAAGRMTPLQEKVDQSNLGNVVKIVGPDAADILQKNGYDPKTFKQAATPASLSASHKVGDTVIYNGAQHTITEIKPNGRLVLSQ